LISAKFGEKGRVVFVERVGDLLAVSNVLVLGADANFVSVVEDAISDMLVKSMRRLCVMKHFYGMSCCCSF
jgi:hypothetical protein